MPPLIYLLKQLQQQKSAAGGSGLEGEGWVTFHMQMPADVSVCTCCILWVTFYQRYCLGFACEIHFRDLDSEADLQAALQVR